MNLIKIVFLSTFVLFSDAWSSFNDDLKDETKTTIEIVNGIAHLMDKLMPQLQTLKDDLTAVFFDCHGVITNNNDPSRIVSQLDQNPLQARGKIDESIRTIHELYPNLFMKILSAWNVPSKVHEDIQTVNLENIFSWNHIAVYENTDSYEANVYGDYFFVRAKGDFYIKTVYFKGKGFAPQIFFNLTKTPVKHIIFIDDSEENIDLFKKQLESTPLFSSLTTVTLYLLDGNPLSDDGTYDSYQVPVHTPAYVGTPDRKPLSPPNTVNPFASHLSYKDEYGISGPSTYYSGASSKNFTPYQSDDEGSNDDAYSSIEALHKNDQEISSVLSQLRETRIHSSDEIKRDNDTAE